MLINVTSTRFYLKAIEMMLANIAGNLLKFGKSVPNVQKFLILNTQCKGILLSCFEKLLNCKNMQSKMMVSIKKF